MALKAPPRYVIASVALSLGGLLNGYDTGSIGAITHMPQFTESIGRLSSTILGVTVSMIMLTGTFPAVFAGHLADKMGRLSVIAPGALLFGIGALLQGTAYSFAQFLAGRAVGGFGQGMFLSNISVYICEIAPVRSRGALAALPQFMAAAGICLGYFTCYATVLADSDVAWRVPYIMQCLISSILAWSCLLLPDSPRWLMLHGRQADARAALERLEFDMAEAERDILTTTQQTMSLSPWQGFVMLFRRAYRARTVLALFILAMVQLSGIDAVTYYAPILFEQAVHPHGIARWVVIITVFVFGLTYCATWGIVGKIYASEIQPGHTRAAANCVAQGLSFFTNWLVAILTPILLEASAFGAYFLFGGLALGTVVILTVYMPETRGRSLENIQEAFQRPTTSSIAQYLRLGQRRRAQNGSGSRSSNVSVSMVTAATVVELEDRDASGVGAASSISVENVARPLRLDVV
ncbi:general substrate transporter [Biscogniauxia marginata]|nr:general substrate transporter [Biscogniauxia marginata]